MQILRDQEVLTTERTRKLLLKIVIDGFLSDVESEAVWEKKLKASMDEHEDDPDINQALWSVLTAQVRAFFTRTCIMRQLVKLSFCSAVLLHSMQRIRRCRHLPKTSTT